MNKEEINEIIRSNIDYYFDKDNQNRKEKTKDSWKEKMQKNAPFYFRMAIMAWAVYYLFKFVQGLGL